MMRVFRAMLWIAIILNLAVAAYFNHLNRETRAELARSLDELEKNLNELEKIHAEEHRAWEKAKEMQHE